MWQVKCTITVSCICFIIDTHTQKKKKKEEKKKNDCTCHIVVPIRMRIQTQGPFRTHTLGPHGYGWLILHSLPTHHTDRSAHVWCILMSRSMIKPINSAPSEDSDQPGHPPSLISLRSLCAQWIAKNTRVLHADSEGFDHTMWMPSLN